MKQVNELIEIVLDGRAVETLSYLELEMLKHRIRQSDFGYSKQKQDIQESLQDIEYLQEMIRQDFKDNY